MVYIVFVLFLCCFSVMEFYGLKNINAGIKSVTGEISFDKILYFFCALYMLVIATFRYKTGADWANYISIFNHSYNGNNIMMVENGYFLLNYFFKVKFNNFYLMQFFIMIFCCTSVYRHFYQESDYPIFTLLLYFLYSYFFTVDMAQTRQYIAMAICCLGMPFINKRKIILWIFMIVFAMQFHITAILAFPLYFTSKIKISSFGALIGLFFVLFLTFFGLTIVRGIVEIVIALPFIPERLSAILHRYFTSKTEGQFEELGTGLGVSGRIFFSFLVVFLIFITKKNKEKYYLFNFMIAIILQAMGRNFDVFSRVANYYFICGSGLCVYNIIPDCRSFFKKADLLRLFLCSFFILFMFLSFSKTFNARYKESWLPYKSFITRAINE